jgi:intron-binding protein aquarius
VFELKPAFDVLFTRPDELTLVTGEMFGETQRAVADSDPAADVDGQVVMTGYEHLAEYVRGITAAKIDALKTQGGQLPTREVRMSERGDEDVDREDVVLVADADEMDGVDGEL